MGLALFTFPQFTLVSEVTMSLEKYQIYSFISFTKKSCICCKLQTQISGICAGFTMFSMSKPTKWPVRPAKTQISLGICPVWSESSLSTWRKHGSLATHCLRWAHVISLVLSCGSSFLPTKSCICCKQCRPRGCILWHLSWFYNVFHIPLEEH